MRNKLILAIIFLMQCNFGGECFGQTAKQIQEKYGAPVSSYSVSEHIWMTPEFADDGQMCRARLYQKRVSTDTNYLGNDLRWWELKDVLNKLAPIQNRGEKGKVFGLTSLGGLMAETSFGYEKVTFTFLSSLYLGPSGKGVSLSELTNKSDEKDQADDIFGNPFVRGAEIVIVSWTGRKCTHK